MALWMGEGGIERALVGSLRMGRRPKTVAAVLAVITFVSIGLLPFFRLNPDFSSLLPEGNETLTLLRTLPGADRATKVLFVVLRSDRPEVLREALPGVVSDLRAAPGAESVIATREEFARQGEGSLLRFASEEMLARMEERLSDAGRDAALRDTMKIMTEPAGKELARRDPLGLRWILTRDARPPAFETDTSYLISKGGRTAIILLFGREEPYRYDFTAAFVEDVERRAFHKPDIQPQVLGGYVTARNEARRIREDLRNSIALSALLVFSALALSTRSLIFPVLVFLPVILAILWTLGYLGALLSPLTPLVVASATILIGLGADYPIYYIARFRGESARSNREESLWLAHVQTGRAILGMMLATSTAFLSFALTGFRSLRGFGLLHAGGLALTVGATLAILPLLLMRAPLSRMPLSLPVRAAGRLRNSRSLAWVLIGIGVAGWLCVALRGIRFSGDPRDLRPKDDPNIAAFFELERELGMSPLPFAALIEASTPLARVHQWAREQERLGRVARVEAPPDPERLELFKNRTRGWRERTIQDLDRLGFRPEAFRAGLEEYGKILAAPEAPRPFEWRGRAFWVVTIYPVHFSMSDADQDAMAESIGAAFGEETRLLNPANLTRELVRLLKKELGTTAGAAAAALCLLACLFTKGLGRGFLAVLPVTLALGPTLALLDFLREPLHLVNFIAIPLVIGIGIDSGINLVLMSGASARFAPASHGVWLSALTTILAFGSLIACRTPGLASFGLVSALGIAFSVLMSLFVLPPFLGWRPESA